MHSGEVDSGVLFHDSQTLDFDVADALGAEAVEADAVFSNLDQLGNTGSQERELYFRRERQGCEKNGKRRRPARRSAP